MFSRTSIATSRNFFTQFLPFLATKDSRTQIFRKFSETALVVKDSKFIRLQIIFQFDVWLHYLIPNMGYHYKPFELFVKFWLNFGGFRWFFKNCTRFSKKIFILASSVIKTEQIIFQTRTYKPASFLNYAKYRVKFSKNWVRLMGLYSISY